MYNQTAVLPVSKERAAYLQKQKRKKYMIRTVQISVVVILLALWEILANIGVIDSFIMSLCRGFNILRDDRMCFGKIICQTQILITHHF